MYIYVGAPVSAVLFRCVAVEVDIPYRYRDKNLSISRAMRLKLTRKYPRDLFTRKSVMNFGIKGVEGPSAYSGEIWWRSLKGEATYAKFSRRRQPKFPSPQLKRGCAYCRIWHCYLLPPFARNELNG